MRFTGTPPWGLSVRKRYEVQPASYQLTALAQHPLKLTVEQFLAFYDTPPDEEQWQLVDGGAILMTPHFLIQRIARNLERLLNDELARSAPNLCAEQRIGIELLPQFPHYRPEPDVVVIDPEISARQRHVDRFYLVAEILVG